VALPQGAVIRSAVVTARDNSNIDEVDCVLFRTSVAPAIGTEALVADFPLTGETQQPGDVRLSASSIGLATVDNRDFVYDVECVTGSSNTTGIWGANIEYTVPVASG
jgi:hypothetical protein